MQQHRLSLVQRQHGAGIKIPQQNVEEEIAISLAQNNSPPQHIRPPSVQIAADAGFGDALRQNSLTRAEEIDNPSGGLLQNRIDIFEGEPYDKFVHQEDIKIL